MIIEAVRNEAYNNTIWLITGHKINEKMTIIELSSTKSCLHVHMLG